MTRTTTPTAQGERRPSSQARLRRGPPWTFFPLSARSGWGPDTLPATIRGVSMRFRSFDRPATRPLMRPRFSLLGHASIRLHGRMPKLRRVLGGSLLTADATALTVKGALTYPFGPIVP